MSSVIDTLEVVFSADIAPLVSRLGEVKARLLGVEAVSGHANASLRALAQSMDFGMASLKSGAQAAGAAVGTAFASGLRSKRGAVDSAVKYLTSSALSSLNKLLSGKSYASAAAGTVAASSVSTVSGFSQAALSGEKAASANAVQNLTIPINVDGVKLGEACIRGINAVTRMTGRGEITV